MFARRMAQLIDDVIDFGGYVIASKDMHPYNHCSFRGAGEDACMNTKDYEHEHLTAGQRYVNAFPSHCTWATTEDNYMSMQAAPDTPFCVYLASNNIAPPWCADATYVGAHFDEQIHAALARAPAEQVDVVYKGFVKDYDSFSAMPHVVSSGIGVTDEEQRSTGGYAVAADRKEACHGAWDTDPSCTLTQEEATERSRSTSDILREKGIEKIFVVGLVYDFCVTETAIFAMEGVDNWYTGSGAEGGATLVDILADFTRPSFDGKPGAPFTEGTCDGSADPDVPSFCRVGGGTERLYDEFFSDCQTNNVGMLRTCGQPLFPPGSDDETTEAPAAAV